MFGECCRRKFFDFFDNAIAVCVSRVLQRSDGRSDVNGNIDSPACRISLLFIGERKRGGLGGFLRLNQKKYKTKQRQLFCLFDSCGNVLFY